MINVSHRTLPGPQPAAGNMDRRRYTHTHTHTHTHTYFYTHGLTMHLPSLLDNIYDIYILNLISTAQVPDEQFVPDFQSDNRELTSPGYCTEPPPPPLLSGFPVFFTIYFRCDSIWTAAGNAAVALTTRSNIPHDRFQNVLNPNALTVANPPLEAEPHR